MKKLLNTSKHLVAALVVMCAVGLASEARAETLNFLSTRYIGSIIPGTPTDPDSEVAYINQLLGMALNSSITISGNTFDRSAFACAGCPTATTTGDLDNLVGASTSLGSGFTYLFVKYSASEGSHVWDIRGLSGTIGPSGGTTTHTFPNVAGQNQFSHYALFNPGTTTVPEPSSFMLLGSGLLALGAAVRLFRK